MSGLIRNYIKNHIKYKNKKKNTINKLLCNQCHLLSGISLKADYLLNRTKGEYWAERILLGQRAALSRGITLLESELKEDEKIADSLLLELLNKSKRLRREKEGEIGTLRIGVTGAPGAGKSTFIESFGLYLVNNHDFKVAVLSIDPSSQKSFGSILADKTRMQQLSRNKNAYIRPSPSGGLLGGVQASTAESMLLCEAYGADVIIVETVGVGQSEIHVADMVDVVLMLVSPGGGDEFQGMKKGVVEVADFIVVNKADGALKATADHTLSDYSRALSLMGHKYKTWRRKALKCSSLIGGGKDMRMIWEELQNFRTEVTDKVMIENRQAQRIQRFNNQIRERLWLEFKRSQDDDDKKYNEMIEKLKENTLTGRYAAGVLTHDFARSECDE